MIDFDFLILTSISVSSFRRGGGDEGAKVFKFVDEVDFFVV